MAEIIYDKGGITLYHGDCRDVLPLIDRVDHTITDPPYEAEAHTLQRRVKRGGGSAVIEALTFPAMTPELRAICGRQFARLTRRWAIVFCQVEAVPDWMASLAVESNARLLRYMRTGVWVKPDAMPQLTGDRPGMGYESFVQFVGDGERIDRVGYESIVVTHADGKSRWNGGGQTGVFTFNKNESEAAIHETQKPQKLMRSLVSLFTDVGDLVLDPFCGSGSTAVACRVLGRRCITIEKDQRYAERALKRFERLDAQGDMFAVQEALPIETLPIETLEAPTNATGCASRGVREAGDLFK